MKYDFLVSPTVWGSNGTFSSLNTNTTVWFATASSSLQIPQYYTKTTPIFTVGMFVSDGTFSASEFYVNQLTGIDGSVRYRNDYNNTTNISVGTNHQTTDITTTQTVYLPSNPRIGDYVWYENHPSVAGRYVIRVNGNGIEIRSTTNSIVSDTLNFGLFHYDGQYWNNIYEP